MPFCRASETSVHALISFRKKKGRMKPVASQRSIALKRAQELVGEGTWGDRSPGLLHGHPLLSDQAAKIWMCPPRVVGEGSGSVQLGRVPCQAQSGGGWEECVSCHHYAMAYLYGPNLSDPLPHMVSPHLTGETEAVRGRNSQRHASVCLGCHTKYRRLDG